MDTLKDTVRECMSGYARKGLNSHSYLMRNEDDMLLSVVTVQGNTGHSFLSLLVRIVADTVIIERDQNDKPLVAALVQAGIPRHQIIVAYAGEAIPAPAVATS